MPPEHVNQVAKGVGADLRRRRRGRRMLPPTPRTRRGATRTEGGRTTSGSGSGSGTSMRPWKSLAGSAPATKSQTSRWRSWGSSTTLLTSSWPSSNRSGRETSTRKWLACSAKRRAQVRCCRTPPTDSHHQPHFTPRAASHPSPPTPLLFCNSCWDILVQNMVFLGKLQCLFACCHCWQTNRQKGNNFSVQTNLCHFTLRRHHCFASSWGFNQIWRKQFKGSILPKWTLEQRLPP